MADLASRIRAVPDFPAPGIVFRDVMPLLADADGFAEAIEALAAPWRGMALQVEIVGATVLVEIEALGGRARCAFAQTLVAVLRF